MKRAKSVADTSWSTPSEVRVRLTQPDDGSRLTFSPRDVGQVFTVTCDVFLSSIEHGEQKRNDRFPPEVVFEFRGSTKLTIALP